AGLLPGGIGLYELDFTVPKGLAGGNLPLILTIGTQISPVVTLPVAPPDPPAITMGGILNGASFAGPTIAPGELVVVFGTNLGDATLAQCPVDSNKALPTSCSGVSILVNGKAAPLYLVSAGEDEFQVPFDVSG